MSKGGLNSLNRLNGLKTEQLRDHAGDITPRLEVSALGSLTLKRLKLFKRFKPLIFPSSGFDRG